ncbi:MAG: AAA family ATPase [Ruminococcus bromii]|nr:AAA family ATPase [Ruminococcus bromii]
MGLNNFTGHNNDNNDKNTGNGMPPFSIGGTSIGGTSSNPFGSDDIDVTEILINYNEKFKSKSTCLFRDEIIRQVEAILIGQTKPNALLVGAPGTGKTKIPEHLAHLIANKSPSLPDNLKQCIIYELPLSNLVAGSSFVGQLEEKCKAVIEFASDPKNHVILFIDEIHCLVSDSNTYDKIAQIFKPALARGDIKVIGATTLQESQNLMNDPALNRRFTRVVVNELSREQTIEILQQLKAGFFTHYNNKIIINDDTIVATAIIADEYKSAGSHRPDTAITLLDRTIADAIINRKKLEDELRNDPQMLSALNPMIPITEKQLKATAKRLMTGFSKKDQTDFKVLQQKLSEIKGQDNAVNGLIDKLKRDSLNIYERVRPLSVLFAGSSGVGKTAIAKIIAEDMTGVAPITLNMTEYNSPASINRIIGSPAGYVGYSSHNELPFDILESNPYQVILLDELEKADIAVQRLFMSALEEGYITTAKGKIVDFTKAIIIATTNAGHKERKNQLGFVPTKNTTSVKTDISELSHWFDTEFLNRFDEIYTFNDIDVDIYREILIDKYNRDVTRILSKKPRLKLLPQIPDDDLDRIVAETYIPEFGARPANKAIKKYIEDQLL